MDLFALFVGAAITGTIWDGIKIATLLTGEWLKARLAEQKFPAELSQSQYDALAFELQNAPSSVKRDISAFKEYLESHHVRPIIEKNLQQQSNQINIVGNVSGVVVGGNVTGGVKNR